MRIIKDQRWFEGKGSKKGYTDLRILPEPSVHCITDRAYSLFNGLQSERNNDCLKD